jgi:O-acetyl-ADP-ribose deacetylase (regulator of RNase III)
MSSFKIIKDSCVNQNVDAIVNAANGYMIHGGGVARAILVKAGPKLNDSCHKYKLPIRDGSVIVTPSFNIQNAKIIIHAVGPDFGRTNDAFGELCDAYYNSLVELKNNNYHTIAFPLISSGIFGGDLENPVAISTKYCIKAYNKFVINNYDYDIDVLLCAYNDEEYQKAIEQQEIMNKEIKKEQIHRFKSIDEIINYLKNEYKKAEYVKPDPSYTIGDDGQKIYYMGGLKYDDRVFDIPKYLIQDKYVEEKYYNKEKYPEFFEENWQEYDFNNLDIGRVSYLILRTFNIERIVEGTIDNMIEKGYMLKLIERAKVLKRS